MNHIHKYIAEGIGTFALTYIVSISLRSDFPLSTPFLAALVLGLFVYTVGHISGCNLNPAITIGLWSIKKITSRDAVSYIVAQLVGALLALLVLNSLFAGRSGVSGIQSSTWLVGFAELLGSFFFGFGVAAVATEKVTPIMSGIVVGGSLLLGIGFAAMTGSNGILNPAVALGINSLNIMYLLAPIVGAVLGMLVYKKLNLHQHIS